MQRVKEKNNCYNEKLNKLKKTGLYQTVLHEFKDTFSTLKRNKEYFGVPNYIENKLDDAIFFGKDSTNCILIVLQRTIGEKDIFGAARIIRAKRNYDKQWKFKIDMEYNFEKDYFEYYKNNEFDNISQLARYSVLINNNSNHDGCEINEGYWFSSSE